MFNRHLLFFTPFKKHRPVERIKICFNNTMNSGLFIVLRQWNYNDFRWKVSNVFEFFLNPGEI
jgi:hypothetical protein